MSSAQKDRELVKNLSVDPNRKGRIKASDFHSKFDDIKNKIGVGIDTMGDLSSEDEAFTTNL